MTYEIALLALISGCITFILLIACLMFTEDDQ